ncbi:hypothetical protein [Lentzea sp. NBRC 102530]|uniref:variant leucine-rich repeat-containing protein n=1 Tax=Lentzea sp. NBRC 102530 TaxID=3032201 RepID=UPI0024A43CBF|nr:hypothetical protein [Lentzea sp. NBRC 102530]GLY51018.1 hypothetical protein Lesp01_46740 [Lentzea sp. NBRC 102530]
MNAELEGLATNPALPAFLLDRLVHDPSLASELAGRTDLTPARVRTLLSHGDSSATHGLLRAGLAAPADVPLLNESVALVVTSHPDADPGVARVLAHHPDATVRAELPEWAFALPPDVIDLLAADPSPDVVSELVLFHTTPLRDHSSPEVRSALARSQHTPADVLASLSAESLARELASNPATPAAVAADLMRWPACRYYLAERTDLPAALYEQLALELEPGVLSNLASNPAVPVHVLRSLAVTTPLRRAVLHNPAIPLDLLVELAPVARTGAKLVPRVESASAAELSALGSSPVEQVRKMVASVAATRADAAGLEELARLGSWLHPRIASNPLCTPELLHRMASGGSAKTLRAVAQHPAASGETLLLCLEDARARYLAAAHPNLPVDSIVELLASEFTAGAAASNPSLPVPVMEHLADGGGYAILVCG